MNWDDERITKEFLIMLIDKELCYGSDEDCDRCLASNNCIYSWTPIIDGDLSKEVRTSMKSNMPVVWKEYCDNIIETNRSQFFIDMILNPKTFLEWMSDKKNRDKWGWVDCSFAEYSCWSWLKDNNHCPRGDKICNEKGQIKHQALTYIKELEIDDEEPDRGND